MEALRDRNSAKTGQDRPEAHRVLSVMAGLRGARIGAGRSSKQETNKNKQASRRFEFSTHRSNKHETKRKKKEPIRSPLVCFQDSEGRELELAAKTASKHAEQAELAGRVAECQAKLEAKLQDLRAVADAKQKVNDCPRWWSHLLMLWYTFVLCRIGLEIHIFHLS